MNFDSSGCKIKPLKLGFIDIRRAYLHASARRSVYIKLPDEDNQPGYCVKLHMSMYGTQDAAQNWEEFYVSKLSMMGFWRGRASPCVFWHPQRNARMVVHGDDFTILASHEDIL